MRVLARIGCTLAALALVAPSAAQAGLPFLGSKGPDKSPRISRHDEKLCGDCYRAKMAAKGIVVPPSPPLPPGTPVPGEVCVKCHRPTAVITGKITQAPSHTHIPMPNGVAYQDAPGHAVVGGDSGYVGNGVDPAPIGMVRSSLATTIPGPAPRSLRDNALMPTSVPAPTPTGMLPANRPHILTHLLNLDDIGRERAEARERRRREPHASISYGEPNTQVNNLPASVVYGRGGR